MCTAKEFRPNFTGQPPARGNGSPSSFHRPSDAELGHKALQGMGTGETRPNLGLVISKALQPVQYKLQKINVTLFNVWYKVVKGCEALLYSLMHCVQMIN